MRTYITISLILLLCVSAFGQQDPYGIVDTVRVADVTASAGERVDVEVYLFNDKALHSLTVPVTFDNQAMTLDTFSLVGSKLEHLATAPVSINNDSGTVLIGGIVMTEDPIPAGTGLLATLVFEVSSEVTIGSTYQFDSAFVPPAGYMLLVTSDHEKVYPAFSPGEMTIVDPNQPPVFVELPTQYGLEGDTIRFSLNAIDPEDSAITYSSLKLPYNATFSSSSGEFVWVPPYVGPGSSAGSPFTLTFTASDGHKSDHMTVEITIANRNRTPVLHVPDSIDVIIGDSVNFIVSANDPDLESVDLIVENLPDSADFRIGNPGYISWKTSLGDTGTYDIDVWAVDPYEAEDHRMIKLNVHAAAHCELDISDIQVVSGNTGVVDINLLNRTDIEGMNLLVGYDPSVLTVLSVTPIGTRVEDWERYITTVDDTDGRIWLDAAANLPGSSSIPPLEDGDGSVMKVNFLVSSDVGFTGQLVRIDFEFLDTLTKIDNTMLDPDGGLIGWDFIDYSNGSIFVKQFEALIGDINLNGVPFEVGDVVYYTNYFIDPLNYPLDGDRWPNSDVNQDGRPGTIGDLILLQNIVGGGGGSPKIAGGDSDSRFVNLETNVIDGGTGIAVECNEEIAGAMFVVTTNNAKSVTVTLPDASAEDHLYWTSTEDVTRILVVSRDGGTVIGDDRLIVKLAHADDAEISIEQAQFSDAFGALLLSSLDDQPMAPKSFSLGQNFPNPFNPSTTIRYSLPRAGNATIKIFNIQGQLVRTLVDGHVDAGHHEVTWNGTNQENETAASGVYFYRLETGTFSETRKMMLIK